MSVEKVRRQDGTSAWRVRWREGARSRSRTVDRKRDADALELELRRRRQLAGAVELLDRGRGETLAGYVEGTWARTYGPLLAPRTRQVYAWCYDAHIEPRLGHVPLRELRPEDLARFQADLLAAGVGPEGVRKVMVFLGGVLQRAAEARRIATNPARQVRKARLPARQEVRPLAPAAVEKLRAVLRHRDATLVSVLAYGGLRPQEARGLRWGHVGERTLVIHAPKTGQRRSVRLLAPLAADLAEWRLATGRPGAAVPVFSGASGTDWTADGFNAWRGRVFAPALQAAGLLPARPYDLRHSFASLLLHEGRSVIYVARQLGHGADLTMRTYGHVIDELEDAPRLPAEDAIRAARETRSDGRRARK